VLGIVLHGLFEEPAVLQALFGTQVRTLDSVFDELADVVDRHFATGVLPALLQC
jgi:adenosylcobyric acid synthase